MPIAIGSVITDRPQAKGFGWPNVPYARKKRARSGTHPDPRRSRNWIHPSKDLTVNPASKAMITTRRSIARWQKVAATMRTPRRSTHRTTSLADTARSEASDADRRRAVMNAAPGQNAAVG